MNVNTNPEEKVAEALSAFTDELNAGRTISVDAFLNSRAELAEQLRPLLQSLLDLRRDMPAAQLSPAESDRLFERIQKRLAEAATPGMTILDRRPDFLILLLHFMKQVWNIDVWGKTKLVKLLFLLGKEGRCDESVSDFYDHYAYAYGAFDDNVPKDTEALASKGVIRKSPPPSRHSWTSGELGAPNEKNVDCVYHLTAKGEKIADALIRGVKQQNPDVLLRIEGIVRKYGKKSTDELLTYTYNTYPETARNSKVRDKYLRGDSKGAAGPHDA